MISGVRRRLLVVLAAVAVGGCLSPTLPLPPPGEPVVSGPDEGGWVRLQGSAPRRSWVHAYNRRSGEGVFQDVPNGLYDLRIQARVGDGLVLWYSISDEESTPLDITVPEPEPPEE